MPYREPGVYLTVKNNPKYIPGGDNPPLIPLIIGSGAKKMKLTKSIVRGSSSTDALPSTTVNDILLVGYSSSVAQWAKTTDYSLDAPNKIKWVEGKGPAAGQTYYVVYSADPEASQYEKKICFNFDDIENAYGPDIQELEAGTPVNPISLGAKIAIEEGAPFVYTIQVKPDVSGNVGVSEYQTALDNYARFISDIWRIIPMDNSSEINSAIATHVTQYSTPEERMERTAIYGAYYASAPTTFSGDTGVLSVIGNYASGIKNERISIPYPDRATKKLSNGVYTELGASYIAAAIAGAESTIPVQQSRTRLQLKSFYELKGIQMTRTEKNKLAEKGVMVLEQSNGVGTPISIRHQLTTDMTSVQTRENSIIAIKDFVAKFYRGIIEPYIGKYNITPEVVTRIEATLKGGKNQLMKLGVIIDGTIGTILQDEDNPDTLLISASIKPPYPCNYIDIVLLLE